MSENVILAAMRRMGMDKDQMSRHGFRAMARTILDQELGIRPDFIEPVCPRSTRPQLLGLQQCSPLPERKKMTQEWADYLDKLKVGADIIPINQSA